MSTGSRGTARERKILVALVAEGWVVYRSAGSHKPADLIALRAGQTPRLIQVKGSARSAFNDFPPDERRALIEQAFRAGAEAWLVWWPPRGDCRWLPPDAWPGGREMRTKIARLTLASDGDVEHALRVHHVTEERTA
jgi:Holliday junction resolvase